MLIRKNRQIKFQIAFTAFIVVAVGMVATPVLAEPPNSRIQKPDAVVKKSEGDKLRANIRTTKEKIELAEQAVADAKMILDTPAGQEPKTKAKQERIISTKTSEAERLKGRVAGWEKKLEKIETEIAKPEEEATNPPAPVVAAATPPLTKPEKAAPVAVSKPEVADTTVIPAPKPSSAPSAATRECERLKTTMDKSETYYLNLNNNPKTRNTPIWENAHYVFWINQARFFKTCPDQIPANYPSDNWGKRLQMKRQEQAEFFSKNCEFVRNADKRAACIAAQSKETVAPAKDAPTDGNASQGD